MPRDPSHPLTPERVALAGVALVDERSLPELTMRRLAGRLQVDPMALYRHVANKEALLSLMSDAILAEVLEQAFVSTDGDVVRRSAVHLFHHLVEHPGRLAVLASSTTTVASAAYSIRLARELVARGVDEQRALVCLRTVVAYIFGAALMTVSEQGPDTSSVVSADVAARLRRHGDMVDEDEVQRLLTIGLTADFTRGLEAILQGFET